MLPGRRAWRRTCSVRSHADLGHKRTHSNHARAGVRGLHGRARAAAVRTGVRRLLGRGPEVDDALLRALRRRAGGLAAGASPLPALPSPPPAARIGTERGPIRRLVAPDCSCLQVPAPPGSGDTSGGDDAGSGGRSPQSGGWRCPSAAASLAGISSGVQPGRRPRAPAGTAGRESAPAPGRRSAAGQPAGGAETRQRPERVCAAAVTKRPRGSFYEFRKTTPEVVFHSRSLSRLDRRCDDDGCDAGRLRPAAARCGRAIGEWSYNRASRGRTACATSADTSSFGRAASMTTQSSSAACRR